MLFITKLLRSFFINALITTLRTILSSTETWTKDTIGNLRMILIEALPENDHVTTRSVNLFLNWILLIIRLTCDFIILVLETLELVVDVTIRLTDFVLSFMIPVVGGAIGLTVLYGLVAYSGEFVLSPQVFEFCHDRSPPV